MITLHENPCNTNAPTKSSFIRHIRPMVFFDTLRMFVLHGGGNAKYFCQMGCAVFHGIQFSSVHIFPNSSTYNISIKHLLHTMTTNYINIPIITHEKITIYIRFCMQGDSLLSLGALSIDKLIEERAPPF